MHALLFGWPWVGLGVAIPLLAGLLLWPTPDHASVTARVARPSRLVWLPLPIYMLHQVEEHGVDLLGRHYHFQVDFCHRLGHASVEGCAGTPLFIFAVNVGSVWIAGVLSGLVGLRRPRERGRRRSRRSADLPRVITSRAGGEIDRCCRRPNPSSPP
jgi:hypothetical protein